MLHFNDSFKKIVLVRDGIKVCRDSVGGSHLIKVFSQSIFAGKSRMGKVVSQNG